MAAPDLAGVAIVGVGAFNPAIIHPAWLADKELIPQNQAEHAMRQTDAQQLIVTPQVAVFVADWLSVQVTQNQAVFSTVDLGREADLRDLVLGIWELLPETPVDAIGINADSHFRIPSEEAWHAFGDRFLPKDFWNPLFEGGACIKRPDGQAVGMRVMTVEVARSDRQTPGFVRVELAPSVRLGPHGVYVGINAHFQLRKTADQRTTASDAARALRENWDSTRTLESSLSAKLSEAV